MAKLVKWNLMTLDGFVEGENRDISWRFDVWGEELERLSIEQLKSAGGLRHLRVDGKPLAGRDRRGRRFDERAAEIYVFAHARRIRLEQYADVRRRCARHSRAAEARKCKRHQSVRQLKLPDSKPLCSGIVILCYEPAA